MLTILVHGNINPITAVVSTQYSCHNNNNKQWLHVHICLTCSKCVQAYMCRYVCVCVCMCVYVCVCMYDMYVCMVTPYVVSFMTEVSMPAATALALPPDHSPCTMAGAVAALQHVLMCSVDSNNTMVDKRPALPTHSLLVHWQGPPVTGAGTLCYQDQRI